MKEVPRQRGEPRTLLGEGCENIGAREQQPLVGGMLFGLPLSAVAGLLLGARKSLPVMKI